MAPPAARPVDLALRTPSAAVRRLGGIEGAVVLGGGWAAGQIVVAAEPTRVRYAEPLAALQELPAPPETVADGAVCGGWFGWLGFEALQAGNGRCALGFYPNVFRYDGEQWWDEALVGVLDGAQLAARRERLHALLAAGEPARAGYRIGSVVPSRGRAVHTAAVERCIEYIRAGDIYQANICLTLTAPFTGSAQELSADLFDALAPPYGAFVAIGEHAVASASPELFLRREPARGEGGSRLLSRPIKGTRPRTGDSPAAEAQRLAGSQKDRAENVMIVDLVRNDLARVARTGSVRVTELLDVVAHPGVWHLVSTVEATLRDDGANAPDAAVLAATLPAGSVSGAPKSRAVQVIAELEDGPRGVYTGAIGYVSPVAGSEFNVAIRTPTISDGRLTLGVGGGITVDSTPVQEWWECFDKAAPILRAAGAAVDDPQSRRPAADPRAAHGIFDTSLVRAGEVLERADHLARLERSCYELYQLALPEAAREALHGHHAPQQRWQRLRIDVAPDGFVAVTLQRADPPLDVSSRPGLDAHVVPGVPGFGGHKWAERSRQTALEAEHPELTVLVADESGVLEATRANVFAIEGGRLITPPLDGRILPGVTRTVLLDIAWDLGIPVELRAIDAGAAESLAVAGSIAGLRWIRCCASTSGVRRWEAPDPLFRELSRRLVARWSGGARVSE